MAVNFVVEALRYFETPGCQLTAAERLALVAIAERARESTRQAWQGGQDSWDLAVIVGVSDITKVLGKLAKRGLECRLARGVDAKGRPLYAHRGAQTTYLFPHLPKGTPDGAPNYKAAPSGGPSPKKGAPLGAQGTPDGAPKAEKGTPDGAPYPSLAKPSYTSNSSPRAEHHGPNDEPSAAAAHPSPESEATQKPPPLTDEAKAAKIVTDSIDATDAEAAAIVDAIQQKKQPRSLVGLVHTIANAGELPTWLADIRNPKPPAVDTTPIGQNLSARSRENDARRARFAALDAQMAAQGITNPLLALTTGGDR